MNDNPKRFMTLVLLGWLCFAVGLVGWFHNASAPAVAATVWMLTALALIACWKIGPIRVWALNVDLRWLVLFHLLRLVAGVYFLVLCQRATLPCAFAMRAGWGDIIVAVDSQPVATGGDLRGWIENQRHPGDTVTITVLRDGQRQDVQVTLSERPAQAQQPSNPFGR